MNDFIRYTYRCRECRITIEVCPQTTLIDVRGGVSMWLSAISDNEQCLNEDYNDALTYIKSKTARRWLTKVYKEIKKNKYGNGKFNNN